jgi:hypothetical protein
MVTGRRAGYREMLTILGRAAGLSTLALATLGSGPCGSDCGAYDECATIDALLTTRAEGIANAEASTAGSAGGPSQDVQVAKAWDGSSCPTPSQYQAIVKLKFPARYQPPSLTAKDLHNDKCCYHVEDEYCGEGRPFLVDGRRRLAALDATAPSRLAPLAQAWLADALMEHASVAAFARLSLQLLALGAPPELVRDAQLASLDELRHADICFGIASRLAGATLRPGPLSVAGALDDVTLVGLVESNLLEGCIGETVAAERLRQRAEQTDDAQLRTTLLEIAEDETRHAALAFRILAWSLEEAPELTRTITERVLAEQRQESEIWQHVLSPLLGTLSSATA